VNGTGSLKRNIARSLNSAGGHFARLVFVGSLRDAYTGHYLHEGWGQVAAADEIHETLRSVHHGVFVVVLSLPLLDLAKELRLHFRSLSQPERETALLWLETEPFRDLIPQGCAASLRELFISQVRTALDLLRSAPGWPELSEPVALPPPLPDQSPLLQWLN
jgi:hypothetical protein